jgi:6-methylsalicylate decarboxylase
LERITTQQEEAVRHDRIRLGTSRRHVLTALATAGVASMLYPARGLAQAPMPRHHGVIDMHHHFWAPEYLKAQDDFEDRHHVPHYAAMQKWTPEVSLAEMDRAGVATAVLSLASISDGFWGLEAPAASRVVRACDDYAAKMMSDHPGRFGLLAPLNMLDLDLSLKDIEYGLDQVHADGIGINTSYRGKYPGNPFYNPLWEELNRRKAIVYLHGPNPACCLAAAAETGPGVNPSVVEVTFDVTRAVLSLLANGTLVRYPDIKWIASYGGGTIPFVAGRIDAFVHASMRAAVKPEEIAPHGVFAILQGLYYDTVNVTAPYSWAALTKFVKPSQIVYGSDFIYFHENQLDAIDQRGLSPTDKAAIFAGNAKRLIPRLAKV